MKPAYLTKIILVAITLLFTSLTYAETVWIDVRSAIEYQLDHIEGDTRISYGDIVEDLSVLYPDKNTDVRLYCRSGGRAGKAEAALKEAGYTQVTNVGSITDARNARGLGESPDSAE